MAVGPSAARSHNARSNPKRSRRVLDSEEVEDEEASGSGQEGGKAGGGDDSASSQYEDAEEELDNQEPQVGILTGRQLSVQCFGRVRTSVVRFLLHFLQPVSQTTQIDQACTKYTRHTG